MHFSKSKGNLNSFDSLMEEHYVHFPMPLIYIYQDYVHNNGGLFKTLQLQYGKENVAFIDADDIKNNALTPRVDAFIMPGGASRYVSDKLNGCGNQAIKDYVSQGGKYIGICAGAYYACRRIEWRPGFDQKFMVDSELGFFPGSAKGPIHPLISSNEKKHMAALTTLRLDNGQDIKSFYWAGPLFYSDEHDDFEILARYIDLPDQPAAIVQGNYKKGYYFLSSPHIEIDSSQLDLMTFNVVDNKYEDIAALPDHQGISNEYFHNLLQSFLNKQ